LAHFADEQARRIDKLYNDPHHFIWIDAAWIAMLIRQKIIDGRHVYPVAKSVLELWQSSDPNYHGFGGICRYVMDNYGTEVGGNLTLGRTIPPLAQIMPVRYELTKFICTLIDFQQTLLDMASAHVDAVMPGYTHMQHAQPTTFGHYLLSIYDPIERISKTIEDSYQAFSLNELGCGALAGTSWPIDRKMVTEYLGFHDLIENCNDAVSYTDGYLLLVAALTNIMAVISRLAFDIRVWSTIEFGYLNLEWKAPDHPQEKGGKGQSRSYFMPNKTTHTTNPEHTNINAAKVLGALTQVAAMAMCLPQQDCMEMMHMIDGTQVALRLTETELRRYQHALPRTQVCRSKMLETINRDYSCATELANYITRHHSVDYRIAHKIVNEFVLESKAKSITADQADLEILEQKAEKIIGRRLGMSAGALKQCLDPVAFVNATNSQGGVAPAEVMRMVRERTRRLEQRRARHLDRIEKGERAKEALLQDIIRFRETAQKEVE